MINDPVTVLPAVGVKRALLFNEFLKVSTIEDILFIRPHRYVDLSSHKLIAETDDNEYATISGKIHAIRISGFKKKYLELVLSDESGSLKILFFGGLQFYRKQFSEGTELVVSGKVTIKGGRVMVHPEFEFNENAGSVNTGRVVPYYSIPGVMKEKGVSSKVMRKIIKHAVDHHLSPQYDDLERGLYKDISSLTLGEALRLNHFPERIDDILRVRERLAFSELFFLQLLIQYQKRTLKQKCMSKQNDKVNVVAEFIATLPFTLTNDQRNAIDEMSYEITGGLPMNRLLQGDVGSGKTVIAACLCYVMTSHRKQSAFMAPTSLLARQHYETLSTMLPELSIALLTGFTPRTEKNEIYKGLADGSIDLVIGTHALIQQTVSFKDLALAVIDEQHRFGIEQRYALRRKSESVHLLAMSATPIPRSLALTLYGDMDVSVIKEKPVGRLPIKTMLISESRAEALYRSIEKYVSKGQQCFFVLPLIDPNDESELTSVTECHDILHARFPNYTVAVVHGKMKSEEKERIMDDFLHNRASILVSTTVIEVGIDIPNATVMVIQHPERFGLAQLHQLRGRVGRGSLQSFCVLFHPDNISTHAKERISILEKSDDGFFIAEKDLELRGAGEIQGLMQSGFSSGFRYADILTDTVLLQIAREKAVNYLDSVSIDKVELAINNRYLRIIS
ncbi:MAG: ATP-dependent DNA helicase RecG [Spirochaetes bacterium]|jgi:ATP-dependent DNA helicase RecG|nr:ATP-dependent DNA helicase RecG [Spirochaetota bacterium]